MTAALAAAQSVDPPAGGAPLGEVLLATGFTLGATGLLIGMAIAHRRGRRTLLGRAEGIAAKQMGLPGWAALPATITLVSLLSALLGVTWDISLHIDDGRDEGPLANPSHYLILLGLYGTFAAGLLSIVLPRPGERPGPAARDVPGIGPVPVGGALLLLCSSFALLGFPLDDLWHRLFGQDVTLWGPTHVMMISGAVLSIVAAAVLTAEGMLAAGLDPRRPRHVLHRLRAVVVPGGLLIGLSVLLGEFDWGVPQFRAVWHPIGLALCSSIALVAARVNAGRGGALAAVGFYLVVRFAVDMIVGAGFGQTMPSMPIYLVEALLVEGLAWRGPLRSRPLALGAAAGVAIGTIGFAAEYAWSHVAMPLPWTAGLLAEGIPSAVVAGVAGGLLGALFALGLRAELPSRTTARRAAIGAAAALAIVGVNAATHDESRTIRATVVLADASGGDEREAFATVRFDPPQAARDAHWLQAIAWQGGGLITDRLEPTGDGAWRTTRPLPLHGDWKAFIRLHEGRQMVSTGLYAPNDEAIPFPGIARGAGFTATMVYDQELLQLERKDDVPGWLWTAGVSVVLALLAAFFAALALGVAALGRARGAEEAQPAVGGRPVAA